MTKKIGKIIFISGPSGVGKGTLISALRDRHPDWIFPPSCTTRAPRPGEIDGKTYFFISRDEFQQKIDAGDFLEWADVHAGNWYGTLKKPLLDGVRDGKTVIREFDVQGYLVARDALPREFFTSIFLRPAESVADLIERIRDRAPISDAEVSKRVKSMERELDCAKFYDFEIISEAGKIEKLVADAEKLISLATKTQK